MIPETPAREHKHPEGPVSIIILGASGDLAKRKIIPALFSLYCQRLLPEKFQVVGFARSEMSDEEFRRMATENLTCRYAPGNSCGELMEKFLRRCFYFRGRYDSPEAFRALREHLLPLENQEPTSRVFYMAIPPSVFLDVARSLKQAGLVNDGNATPWSRAVIEKPFGSDRASSDELVRNMAEVFEENQTYRIDHYLGKEVIQNLLVLRFANLIFDPIWNRAHIENVQISWKEDLSVEGRAGYFDGYGIIRDVIQNHLLQILALIAMEEPLSLDAKDVRDEKVKLLRAIPPVELRHVVVGQYTEGIWKGTRHASYLDEDGVPKGSTTPTFAAAVLHVANRRWDGVPFLIRAGKGLNDRMTEIRVVFRETPGRLYDDALHEPVRNELIIRVQPDEAIVFRIMNKTPGLEMDLGITDLNLRYQSTYRVEIPDAYECLLLDVIEGDESLFIRSDELAAAWDIFTPVLRRLEEESIQPEPYVFGTEGPRAAAGLAGRFGTGWR